MGSRRYNYIVSGAFWWLLYCQLSDVKGNTLIYYLHH